MPFSSTLPVVAGLSIFGAALGITLGRDAIAEINPAYFGEPDDAFHADLVPRSAGADWAQVHQVKYRAAQQPVTVGELGSGCVGCRDYPIAYVPRHDPAVDFDYADSAETNSPRPVQAVAIEAAAPDPAREQIVRYASYPVSREETPAAATETAEAPAEEAAAPTGL